ncbi:PaaI family thioesterase [Acinetobacter qingfengensis]|nr:PaaI family thioesterase [Acinetobacter qingfengensis]KAA8731332.1 PaaI family thioesterase [Acinetobacter qingfengensis]
MFDFLKLPPIHHFLGGHDIEWDAGQRTLQIKYQTQQSFTNPRGSIEGGMICAILDDVMGVLSALNHTERPATTINLHTDFFRPCQVGIVATKAWFIKEGQKVLSMESEAWQDNKLIAKCSAAFLVL